MSYTIEKRLVPQKTNADGPYPWYTPAQAQDYYKRYSREGITIHHWAKNGAENHEGIVKFFEGRANGSTNYVLSDNKITMMVDPVNVAWTSQKGNPTTISIEHQSDLGPEGYKKSGWLVCQLEKQFKRRLTFYPHKYWYNTACPGTIDMDRIRREADNWHNGGNEMPTAQNVQDYIKTYTGVDATAAQKAYYTAKSWTALATDVCDFQFRKIKSLEGDAKALTPGKYIVKG